MITSVFQSQLRSNIIKEINGDLTVIGGGLAGVCAAIGSARSGLKVTLVQDRPVLGGNSSSEIRLWTLGATSHMGNNNRYSREGGIVDEILVENLYRNKEGNAVIFDTVLLDKVLAEKNITLLLDTAAFEVTKRSDNEIESVTAFCPQNSTTYKIKSPLFCDASGDGIVSFLAGAAFRMGAESKEDFGELFAPDKNIYGELLGHTIYFYSKNAGQPVKYVAPNYALKDITKLPKYKIISDKHKGCNFWWLEYGGRLDTIAQSQEIKLELWSIVYGIWDYIKNSGNFPEANNLTLEWVGTIPGKRESRRFEGLYMLKQQDIVDQTYFYDAVSIGGWALDLHPSDGVYSELPSCTQYHGKGVYNLPLRSFISKDINNLFFAGRIISATHLAFGSSRVMATCAHGGSAVGYAASYCLQNNLKPHEIVDEKNIEHMRELQQLLNENGQSISRVAINQDQNIATKSQISVSSQYQLNTLKESDLWHHLDSGIALMLPLKKEQKYNYSFKAQCEQNTELTVQLRISDVKGNFTPNVVLTTKNIQLNKGQQNFSFEFEEVLKENQYAFITFLKNDQIKLQASEERLTGLLTLFNTENKKVGNTGKQENVKQFGFDEFEFWIPKRRPDGQNLTFKISPELDLYDKHNVINEYVRPYLSTNAWCPAPSDKNPWIEFNWSAPQTIREITLFFDTDYDHAMENVFWGHPEDIIPFCVEAYTIYDDNNNVISKKTDNYQTMNKIEFGTNIVTTKIRICIDVKKPGNTESLLGILLK